MFASRICFFFYFDYCYYYLFWSSWFIYLRKHYYSKCVLVDIHIYYHFKKDERTEADRSVCFIWFFSGLCLFLCRVVFMPAKPMWKLYLVWAILSSVTLLYVISNRCNVMSTIKTHTHTSHLLAAALSVFCFCCRLLFIFLDLPRRLNTSKSRWRNPSSLSPPASVKCRTLCLNIDSIRRFKRISLPFVSRVGIFSARPLTAVRHHSHLQDFISLLVFWQLWSGVDWWKLAYGRRKWLLYLADRESRWVED